MRYWIFSVVVLALCLIDYEIDSSRVLVLLLITILGGMLGWFIRWGVSQTLGKMQRFEPMKKYF